MNIRIECIGGGVVLRQSDLVATPASPIRFAHLGLRTLNRVVEDRNKAQREAQKHGVHGLPTIPAAVLDGWTPRDSFGAVRAAWC